MKLWRNLLIGGFLLTFVLLLGFFNSAKPRIMVLHSGPRDRRGCRRWTAECARPWTAIGAR